MVVDALIVMPLALLCLATAGAVSNMHIPFASALMFSALLLPPLLWRRRWPREVFALVSLISFVQWLPWHDSLPANLAVLIALYSVASRCTTAWAIAAWLVAEFGLLLMVLGWGSGVEAFPGLSAFVITVWIAGKYANTRRRYVESLVERAERAERDRDQQARIAAADERARIARELHDVVAHNVSVIVVQADGAGYAIDSDPELARRAVQTISATGREALAEMRRLVGVLRRDTDEGEEYSPQPGLGQLDELIAHVRSAGLPVNAEIEVPTGVPEGEQLVIYRVVQEALTNTLKHGGPGARSDVSIDYGRHEVVIRVTDDGRGAAARVSEGGHGLIGMRERIAMYGGTVHAGPIPGGGFQVLARLPVGSTI
jgi:signal transduction histidine kinase